MTTRAEKIIALARAEYEEDSIEIDDNAKLSEAEGNPNNGAYVAAWVWVSFEGNAHLKPRKKP